MIDTWKENAEFQAVDIYYRDTQTGSVYVDPDDFEKNTTLKKAGSSDTYQLSETKQLKGVYNINRGYAVFRQVDILDQNEEYAIISSNTSYGLSRYDRIARDSSQVKEQDILY